MAYYDSYDDDDDDYDGNHEQNEYNENNSNHVSSEFAHWRGRGHNSSNLMQLTQSEIKAIEAMAPIMAQSLGYGPSGIVKRSLGAQGMQKERQELGYVPSMKEGGVSASLQSIGATGRVKPAAARALAAALYRNAHLQSSPKRLKGGSSAIAHHQPHHFTQNRLLLPTRAGGGLGCKGLRFL
ncbi:hypothetical protein CEUSTIGMA_g8866.t1 [Chlamydomonas eustigma]|uniref:Uncharacterized protein n=1 Tax=Chlamydomonas eustigma TaxID=1157962 RepID=A0A250XEF7_9CHLO|nr:hypothetical protein CEUSTIGMA_g8866.t1 [Chlamydomonas eustigma]|eukprot:GAX81436.1 hypothetical protein CEUSTIGMA_g8866.t1 [Chlamydomonas eustigma]